MANDQFNIPGNLGDKPLQEAMRVADSVQHAPEHMAKMFEYNTKAPEERIYGYRKTALDIEENRKKGLLETLFGIARLRLTLKSLIESESFIGGEPFGPHNRFWLSHKGSSALGWNNNIGDWYHVRETFDSFGRKTAEVTIHFETHPTHIIKLYNGRPVQLTIAELETFVHAVELYEKNIRERLYPLDQEIYDLNTEIDEENPVLPDRAEERSVKEIAARVLAEYKAKKNINSAGAAHAVQDSFGAQAIQQITDDTRTTL